MTAVYSGSADFNASTSAALAETVSKSATTTSVVSSLDPATYASAVTFTATIVPALNGPISGTVTFKDGATTLGAGAVNTTTRKATFASVALAVGAHSITAVYSGDTDFNASTSAALAQTVNKAATTTSVVSSLDPSTYGTAVTFTATIVPAISGPISGTVTFKDGAATLGAVAVNTTTHKATFATPDLAVGAHSITAVYGGDSDFNASTSAALAQTVNKAVTTTSVASSLDPSTYGSAVTFTASIVPGTSGPISGTVTFKDGATALGTGTVNTTTYKATFATTALAVGAHSITAVYNGDTDFNGSTSAVLAETVNKAATTTSVASSVNPSSLGTAVTFTATIVPASGVLVSGTVTFKDGATTLGTGTVNTTTHKATFATSTLAVGTHSITAVYSGSTDFNASTSPTLSQVVN